MKDMVITCVQCQNPFVVELAERKRIVAKGFGLPKRCTDCRKHKLKPAVTTNQKWREKGRIKNRWRVSEHNSVAR